MKKIFSLSLLSLASLLFFSCASSPKPLLATSETISVSKRTAKQRPAIHLKRGVVGKDKHGMPTYHAKATQRLVRTTAYTHSEADHLKYRRMNAIGSTLRYGKIRSAAADWSVYPVGTQFKIKGLPYTYVVDDYGSALVGTNTVDLYKPSRSIMNRWGVRKVEVQVVKWGSFKKSAQLLKGRIKYKHCRKMYHSILGKGVRL